MFRHGPLTRVTPVLYRIVVAVLAERYRCPLTRFTLRKHSHVVKTVISECTLLLLLDSRRWTTAPTGSPHSHSGFEGIIDPPLEAC